MTHIPMAQFHYHFSAARLPRNNVVLYITTNGVPLHLTSEEIGAVWRGYRALLCAWGFSGRQL